MKNMTKKILSMLMAVIMLLSVIPMAFATEKNQYDLYVDEYIKLVAYADSIYEPKEFRDYITDTYVDILWKYNSREWAKSNPEELPDAIKELKAANEDIEQRIANGEAIIAINFYALIEADYYLRFYSTGDVESFMMEILNYNEVYAQELYNSKDEINRIINENGTQEEFDTAAQKLIDFYKAANNHFEDNHNPYKYEDTGDGTHKIECSFCGKNEVSNHLFVEYISNNDATEESDGTKTATCEFCGATDTIIDIGSKLDSKDDSCSCNCHKGGFNGIIWKILNFFYKLFGINKTCACGVAHY